MALFEENEYVIYKGDGSTLYEPRRNPSLAIVDEIDDDKFPYVGLQLIPSGEKIGVEARLIRSIETTEKSLLKLGFQKHVNEKKEHYTLSNVIIGGVLLIPKLRSYYFAGFRLLPSIPVQINTDEVIKDGEVQQETLETLFPNMHNLNHLVKYLNDNGYSNMTIPQIVDIEPYY